jgi:hypothetical protein
MNEILAAKGAMQVCQSQAARAVTLAAPMLMAMPAYFGREVETKELSDTRAISPAFGELDTLGAITAGYTIAQTIGAIV